MSAERRGCGQIIHCCECKFGEEVPSTMFCRLLYEKPAEITRLGRCGAP